MMIAGPASPSSSSPSWCFKRLILVLMGVVHICTSANILMITMGGTKSHKIPFWELARGLAPRGHNITFVSGFTADFLIPGMEEITPASLVFYIKNFTDWDLLGARMAGDEPVPPADFIRYAYEACDVMLSDSETQDLLHSRQTYDLLVVDGAYPECAMGLAHHYKAPYIFINTVGFYIGSLSLAGNPAPYSFTPFLGRAFTDSMSLTDRMLNTGYFMIANLMHKYTIEVLLQNVLRKHFGVGVPGAYEMAKNVSFILQNAHASVSYARPYLPHVAEIACIHCRPAKPLSKNLEEFINNGGDYGFIYVSMGSSVKADNMPEYLRRLFLRVFEQLPYKVLWKFESTMTDLPDNVKISAWLPQQDLLGHKKIRAFITHGGLLSMFETVYHGVPVVTMPVFCDHDANAAKAELDGYAVKLELQTITADQLLWAIKKIIHEPKYKTDVKHRQLLLRDQKESPLERAVYWTEYVLRHKGASHLQSPARHLNLLQYYLIDVVLLLMLAAIVFLTMLYYCLKHLFNLITGTVNLHFNILKPKMKND